ncbi:helix-turn-helix transcriptional regulator [Actinoplanes sp. NPDC049668]|uniref:helix-turn-helix transcriptional regulator n=1 Tax=unclassified Actinoplanes TaxID=2626549 RepID=UPI0033A7AC8F
MSDEFAAAVAGVAALGEPVRRSLYRYVVAQDRPVGREDAAAGVGVAHHVAKFHLDKLAADGLLDVEYRRPPGRSGPGAGRPTKLYRRGAREITVSLPERRYDLAGQVMAEALTIAARDALPVADAVRVAARAAGRRLADAAEPGADPPQRVVGDLLARYGYEPRVTEDGVALANCPFHHLAQTHTELVCGINLDLIDGVLDRLCPGRLSARLDPGPDHCCVAIGTTP